MNGNLFGNKISLSARDKPFALISTFSLVFGTTLIEIAVKVKRHRRCNRAARAGL